jgi:guanine deaminase
MPEPNPEFMRAAIAESFAGMHCGDGGPFGAVIVKDGQVIAKAHNQVLANSDPTAHAEVMAIREACRQLGHFQLDGCELYTSCEPCPMCLGAIYWARLDRIYYGNTKGDAAEAGFDDQFIYDELAVPMGDRQLPIQPLLREEAQAAFQEWMAKSDKMPY